ncbi:TPA: hypothetical protein NOT46_005787 [Pseudomonas aeruginosa]|nr:hypothetical protein [Pseudomonas aeruginosa]HCI2894762.1 hypothetical protein [Pseudomonas aeruginosa]HCI4051806.1 hypothetical protein [Pseudomonas aeruginosa]
MALNSAMHEIYLSMPVDAYLMPELQGLPVWARTAHEMLLELNPAKLAELAKSNQLEAYLVQQQTELSEQARKLETQWKQLNPLSMQACFFKRAIWQNHSKQYAREVLIESLTRCLVGEVGPIAQTNDFS